MSNISNTCFAKNNKLRIGIQLIKQNEQKYNVRSQFSLIKFMVMHLSNYFA